MQTPQGLLTLQTVFPLPPNASIVLQLQSLAPQLQFQIAAINDKPPRQSLRGPPGTPSGAPSGALSGRPAVAGRAQAGLGAAAPGGSGLSQVNLAVGATVVATLVRTSSAASPGVHSRVPSGGGAKTGPLTTEGVGHGTIQGASPASRSPVSAGNGRVLKAPGPGSAAPSPSTERALTALRVRAERAPARRWMAAPKGRRPFAGCRAELRS